MRGALAVRVHGAARAFYCVVQTVHGKFLASPPPNQRVIASLSPYQPCAKVRRLENKGGWGQRMALACALACLLALMGLGWPASAQAQTLPEDGTTELTRAVSGPFEITVLANPVAPFAGLGSRFSILVTRAGVGTPVTDAEVHIQATWPDGRDAGRINAPQDPRQPGRYEALLRLREAGVWQYTVVVESTAGAGDTSGPITVVQPPAAGWSGTAAWLTVLGVIVAGLGLFWWRFLRHRGAPQ